MYPSTAAWWSQYHQSRAVENFSAQVSSDAPPGNEQRIADAVQYNEMLSAGDVVIGADSRKPTTDGAGGRLGPAYDDILDLGDGVMGRITIPAIEVDLPIYHGTSDETLLKGVGHLEGTSFPVGGADTHSVLTAHRGLASATLFNDLDRVAADDTFTIATAGEVLTYRVIETQVVEPDDTETLVLRPGEDLVTLVTCTPLGVNSHRILVTGERVTPTPVDDVEAAGEVPDIPGFPWWAVVLSAAVVAIGVFVWRAGYPPRRREPRAVR